ncbi:tryptophan-rich sensory protein [Nonomuraea mesophila]|uniref:Tryptophan-rich sensory protein n=1 Tax=Nonomuraea mesophila TaxID=2530382 RepID=A0A4R5FIG5_9ACTN|nr:TspO/MBR family protein [Nonomuraea mesophila]TDE51515.1 tryptophan-rich sensory protein [Nonomuraea mesophila]
MKGRLLLKTALAVTATAVAGTLATDARSTWYQRLKKPSWQPPPQAFGLVWTPLYVLIACAGTRALSQGDQEGSRAFKKTLATNLALNAAWPALFFRARNPKLALAEILVLNASNAMLVRRGWTLDRRAGLFLLPYAGWTVFATALNTAIARQNDT